MKIAFDTYDGIRPAVTPRNLPDKAAQLAENVDLSAGRLDPWKVPLLVQAITNSVSIYPWERNSATEWLSWAVDTDVVRSPVANDTYERIYLTDGVKPKIIGWAAGAKVERDMERPTGTTITATATDRDGFSAANAAAATLKWQGITTITYKQKVGSADPTSEKDYNSETNFIGTLFAANRDTTTGAWTLGYSFFTFPIWTKLASSDTKIYDITVTLAGTWRLTWNGTTYNMGDTVALDDGAAYGSAVVIASLPTPSYSIGKNTVTGADFTGSITLVPTFVDSSDVRYIRYLQTLVDDWGMEGPESAVSNEVTWVPGQKVVLSGFGSEQGMSYRRFYRNVAGSTTTYKLVVEQAVATTTYTDKLMDLELGEELPELENPPDTLKGIVMLPGGFAAAFRDNELLFSEPEKPWSWPSDYRVALDWKIVGLGVLGNDLYVLTEGLNYVYSGYHPENMAAARLDEPQPCVAKRSIAALGPYMAYASPDGLCGIRAGHIELLTRNHYSRADWQALTPANMIGSVYERCYFGWLASGGIVYALGENEDAMTTLTDTATEAFYDLNDDKLYIVQDDGAGGYNINQWNAGATYRTLRWRSKEFAANRRIDWTCARIYAETFGTVTLKIYAENTLVSTSSVTSQDAIRLAKFTIQRCYSVQVEAAISVNRILLGTSKKELM